MPTRDAQHSLIDDVEFLAELEKFDTNHSTVATDEPPSMDEAAWHNRPMFPEPDPPPAEGLLRGQTLLGVIGFLLLMCLGAGVAAFVFRDRLALILR